jgi:hypothetical protein
MAKKVNTKVLSTRVSPDVAKMFSRQAKKLGISQSQLLKQKVMGTDTPVVYEEGGLIEVPDDIRQVLSGVGGIAIGGLVYKAVHKNLEESDAYTKDQIVMYSSVSAIACGLLGGVALHELIRAISK